MSVTNELNSAYLFKLETELASKEEKLLRAEKEVIKLSERCADLMTKELKSGVDDDSWSLGSAGSLAESDSTEVRSLKEKLIKLKQNEEYLNNQLEVLKSTVQLMIHPDDTETREKEFISEIAELKLKLEELLVKNMSMKVDISQVEDLKSEIKKLHEANEKKTTLIEELQEKLAKYGEQNSVLLESLQETTTSEETLRHSLTKIQSTENISSLVADNSEVKQLEESKSKLLCRLNSLEDKDTRLRDRLQQVEEREQILEAEIEKLQEELKLNRDINANQEETILDLQQELALSGSRNEKERAEQIKEELELTKDINANQEDTILTLQQQLAQSGSITERQRVEKLEEELKLNKDINANQDQAILDLQHQLLQSESSNEKEKSKAKIKELEKKCSNMKLLMSQKMEELEFSRKTITSLEISVTELQTTNKQMEHLRERVDNLAEELNLTKDINTSQEETIRNFQTQMGSDGSNSSDLTDSYHDQLTKQLTAEDMEEMQAEYQKETTQLRNEIDTLNRKLDECLSTHQPELSRLQARVVSLEDQLQESTAKANISQNVIQELKVQNKKLALDSKKEYEEKLKDLNMKLQGEKVQNSVHRDVIASMSPQIEKLSCENEAHETTIKILKEKLSVMEAELTRKKNEIDSTKSRLATLERKNDDSRDHSNLLQSQITATKQNLDQKTAESDNLAVDLIEMTDKCSELEKRLSFLATELQSSQTEKVDLHKHCDDYSRQLSTLTEMSNNAEHTKANLDVKEVECQQLQTKLNESHAELSQLRERLVNVENLHQESESEIKEWKDNYALEEVKLAQSEETNHVLTSRVQEMKESVNEQQLKIETLEHTENVLNDRLSAKLLECQSLAGKLCETEQQAELFKSEKLKAVEEYELELAALCHQNAELEKRNSSESITVAELQALVIIAARDLQGLESQRESLLDNLDHAQRSVVSLNVENEKFQQEKNQMNQLLSAQQVQSASLKSQIANLNAELSHISHANERTVDVLKRQIYGLTQDKSTLQNRNDNLVIQLDEILSEKQVYIDEIEKLACELKLKKTNPNDFETGLQQEVDSLNSCLGETNNASSNISSADNQSESAIAVTIQTKLHKATAERNLSADNLTGEQSSQRVSDEDELIKEMSEQKLEIKHLRNLHSSTEAANLELVNKNPVLLQQVSDNKAEVDDLKQSLEEERNRCIYLLNKQSEKHKADMDSLQETLAAVRMEQEELKHQINSLRNGSLSDESSEVSMLSSQIVSLQNQNEQLCSDFQELQDEHLNQLSTASVDTSILQAQLENMNEVVEKLNKEVQFVDSLRALSSELQNRLRDEKKAHAATHSELNDLKAEQVTFKEREQDLKEKYEHSQLQCDEFKSAISQAEHQLVVEQENSTQQVFEYEELSRNATSSIEEVKNLLTELAKRESEIATLKGLLVEKSNGYDKIVQQNTLYLEQLKTEQMKVEELSDSLLSVEAELSTLKTDGTPQGELENLKSQLHDQKAICDLAKAAVALQVHTRDNSSTNEQIANTINQDSYIQALQSELKMMTDEVEFAKKENDDLSEQLSDLHGEYSEISKKVKGHEKLCSDYESLITECDHLKERLCISDKRIDELTSHMSILESKKLSLEVELDSVRANHISILTNVGNSTAYAGRCNELENNVEELEEMLQGQKQTNLLLQHERDDLIAKLSNSVHASEKLDSLQKQTVEKDDEIARCKELLIVFESRVTSLTSELDHSNVKRVELSEQLETLKKLPLESDSSGNIECSNLQARIVDLEEQLQTSVKHNKTLKIENADLDLKVQRETDAMKQSLKEVEKLQMSTTLLMSSHETEMASLQATLQDTKLQMADLEEEVTSYLHRNQLLQTLIAKVNTELKDIRTSKDDVVGIMNDLISHNKIASTDFQNHLFILLTQIRQDTSEEQISEDMLIPQHSSTLMNIEPISHLSTPGLPTSSPNDLSPTIELLATASHYGTLSKSDLVAKLSDQTKHELILRKNLEEARQSLMFYRSAIDNIIDCLGTAMPDVKKWATDFLNSGDHEFSQRLDALINNESALQRRCHSLEISEKALKESFETKEKEYQSAIQSLEDMVALLKSSKVKLAEELKLKSGNVSLDTEQQITDLKQKVYELENTLRKLRVQNEEIHFAYEQECDRRQIQEEERFKADQRSRLNTVEVVRETEYLSKIASLETKISNMLKTQKDLETTIEHLKHDSSEEEFKVQIETLERSERALLRKIEILQQSDVKGSISQYDNTLDRPEDLLRQKIWELEKMETHLKQQVSDLEHDREELHEIARSDKNIIHELNIQIAEGTLANKNLKVQVSRSEHAEEVLYSKLDNAETSITELEQKLKEAFDSEKSMRFQLEDVEYSEDSLRFRTGNMERSLETLQDAETELKKTIDDLTTERQQAFRELASAKSQYKELERDQLTLRNKLMETENREITLKGKISELSALEASLQIRIRELELENERLMSRTLHLERSTTEMRDNLSNTFLGKDELNNRIQAIMSAEKQARLKIAEVEAEKFELEKKLQDVNFKYVQSQSQVSKDENDGSRMSERLAAALTSERQTKVQLVKLEAVIAAYESKQTSGIVERENFQLNAENKILKDKLKGKEHDLRDLEEKVTRLTGSGNSGGGTYRVNRLQAEVKDLLAQLKRSEESRDSLEKALLKHQSGKVSCGHEAEISALKTELKRIKETESRPIHTYPAVGQSKKLSRSPTKDGAKEIRGRPQDSLRTQCLKELITKVNQRSSSIAEKVEETSTGVPSHSCQTVGTGHQGDLNDTISVASDDVASQSSIWEKLEPPVRCSPRPTMSAQLVPPTNPNVVPAIDVTRSESGDELADLEDVVNDVNLDTPSISAEPDHMDPIKQSPAFSNLSVQTPQAVQAAQVGETKDIARLKQTVADLERRLKSRETEIRMLRNQQREVEKESSVSGDLYTLKTKLKALQEEVEVGEKKISTLRSEIISRDKNLTNRQREIVELRLELRKFSEEHKSKEAKTSATSTILSPGSKQRPIQMSTSPGRQTTVEQEPTQLYKSMIESKDSHINDLTRRLDEKNSAVARLERELTDVKIAVTSPNDPNAAKFKYLDDKYTEAATRCYNMKQEHVRDEWKRKYDEIVAEHAKCQPSEGRKCGKCKQLKQEIRQLQKELYHYKKKRNSKKILEASGDVHKQSRTSHHSLGVSDPAGIFSQDTSDEITSLSEDTLGRSTTVPGDSQYTRSNEISPPSRPHRHSKAFAKLPAVEVGSAFSAKCYEVISDYKPRYFSTSGRLAQEVALSQGQRLKVLEQADDTGYCRAEVNGKIRLVPMKYLQLVDGNRIVDKQTLVSQQEPTMHHSFPPAYYVVEADRNIQPIKESLDQTYPHADNSTSSPARVSSSISSPARASSSISSPTRASSSVVSPLNRRSITNNAISTKPAIESKLLRKPQAPTGVTVEIIANRKLYVEWTYIQHMDHSARSNGTKVNGFRVFLNGHSTIDTNTPYTTVASVDLSKAQLADLHTVSVQALGVKSTNSSLTHITVSPHISNTSPATSKTMSPSHHQPSKLDGNSEKKRLFMAYYDYNPVNQGPYSKGYKTTCDDELPLKTGDFVIVYGEPKPNGFYFAEINGRTGYVPESFIKQVPAENAKRFGLYENDVYLHK